MTLISSLWTLTVNLRNEYLSLFNAAQIKPGSVSKVQDAYNRMLAGKTRYQAVANFFNLPGIPWYLIGVLHMRESTFDFTKHLHNGDSLNRRTVNYPPNRPAANPKAGIGKPYTWEESAIDAIAMKLADSPPWYNHKNDSSVESLLNKIESYNGAGYRLQGVPSAYVWSDSTVQRAGKYTSDGNWNPSVIDTQVGAGTLLKYFLEQEAKKKEQPA